MHGSMLAGVKIQAPKPSRSAKEGVDAKGEVEGDTGGSDPSTAADVGGALSAAAEVNPSEPEHDVPMTMLPSGVASPSI
ncbi:hypothetical protein FGB62_53g06 [Gracilaria domingensis]|nr:hypothetical protein FGB62_53g06 [Gracilaria domingensis]